MIVGLLLKENVDVVLSSLEFNNVNLLVLNVMLNVRVIL